MDGAVKTTASFHEKHYPAFQNAKDQYLKVVEENVTAFREKGVKGSVNSAADAVLARTDGVVTEAKKLPGFVNKQTEVALDRVEDAFNQVTSYPFGKAPLLPILELSLASRLGTYSLPADSCVTVCAFHAVQRVWTQAKPTADFAWKKYQGVHNFVVVSALLFLGC